MESHGGHAVSLMAVESRHWVYSTTRSGGHTKLGVVCPSSTRICQVLSGGMGHEGLQRHLEAVKFSSATGI